MFIFTEKMSNSKPLNYSKWDNIELSDDETTYHPNIDAGLMIKINRIQRERKKEEFVKIEIKFFKNSSLFGSRRHKFFEKKI